MDNVWKYLKDLVLPFIGFEKAKCDHWQFVLFGRGCFYSIGGLPEELAREVSYPKGCLVACNDCVIDYSTLCAISGKIIAPDDSVALVCLEDVVDPHRHKLNNLLLPDGAFYVVSATSDIPVGSHPFGRWTIKGFRNDETANVQDAKNYQDVLRHYCNFQKTSDGVFCIDIAKR